MTQPEARKVSIRPLESRFSLDPEVFGEQVIEVRNSWRKGCSFYADFVVEEYSPGLDRPYKVIVSGAVVTPKGNRHARNRADETFTSVEDAPEWLRPHLLGPARMVTKAIEGLRQDLAQLTADSAG